MKTTIMTILMVLTLTPSFFECYSSPLTEELEVIRKDGKLRFTADSLPWFIELPDAFPLEMYSFRILQKEKGKEHFCFYIGADLYQVMIIKQNDNPAHKDPVILRKSFRDDTIKDPDFKDAVIQERDYSQCLTLDIFVPKTKTKMFTAFYKKEGYAILLIAFKENFKESDQALLENTFLNLGLHKKD